MPELQHQSAERPLFPASARCGSAQALAADIAAALDAPHGAVARIRAALERAVSDPDLLDTEQRAPGASCYARHVIHSDPRGRFTILAIVWGAGQFSPPHAHDTWCAYAVYDGPLQEAVYAVDAQGSKAKAICTNVRNPGYSCFAGAGFDQIHRLGNAGTRPAISIHVYGVERDRIGTHVNRIMEIDDEKGSAA